jgi:hypothetical protein
MAVVSSSETTKGTGVTGRFGESFIFTRRWKVRVDDPFTSRTLIARAPGIGYGAAHPDFSNHKAMEFEASDDDDSGLWWTVSVRYYIPPKVSTPDTTTNLPKDVWNASGTTATGPVWLDKDGHWVVNSASDPLEGLEREYTEFSWTLTKSYSDDSWKAAAKTCSGAVNSATWDGAAVRSVKCSFRSAQRKELAYSTSTVNATIPYTETVWEFAYRPETWDFRVWDVGFNQLVNSSGTPSSSGTYKAAILGLEGRPVKQPAPLGNGVALSPGATLNYLTFRVYPEVDFSTYFGSPT